MKGDPQGPKRVPRRSKTSDAAPGKRPGGVLAAERRGKVRTDRAKAAEDRLRAAHAVWLALESSESLREAAPRLLGAVGDCLGWSVGALWQVDPAASVLKCVDVWRGVSTVGTTFEALTRGSVFPPGIGLPGRVWQSARPAWVSDVVRDPNFPRARIAEADGLHGAFAFPLMLRNDVLGVIEFFSPEIREPDEAVLDMFAIIGGQIGQFIERRNADLRARMILEKALDAYVSMSSDGLILDWNASAEQLFGWTASEAIGRRLADTIIPASHRRAHGAGLARFLETGEGLILAAQIETTALRRDGSEFPVELAITPIRVNDVWTFHGFIRDITTRKRIERALRGT